MIMPLKFYINNLQNANSLNDPTNKTYNGTKINNLILNKISAIESSYNYSSLSDTIIEKGSNDSEIVKHDIKDSNSPMYISYNNTLEFPSGDGGITKFALIRTKIDFGIILSDDYVHMGVN